MRLEYDCPEVEILGKVVVVVVVHERNNIAHNLHVMCGGHSFPHVITCLNPQERHLPCSNLHNTPPWTFIPVKDYALTYEAVHTIKYLVYFTITDLIYFLKYMTNKHWVDFHKLKYMHILDVWLFLLMFFLLGGGGKKKKKSL